MPAAVRAARSDDVLRDLLPVVANVRERVLEMLQQSEPVNPRDWFVACYGEEILRNAVSSSHQEWLDLSTEVARIAGEIVRAN